MENIKVYRLNEYDAVAALSEEQAKEWYLRYTGIPEDEAFDGEITVVSLDYMVYTDEKREDRISVHQIIKEEWEGKPFIVFSTEY